MNRLQQTDSCGAYIVLNHKSIVKRAEAVKALTTEFPFLVCASGPPDWAAEWLLKTYCEDRHRLKGSNKPTREQKNDNKGKYTGEKRLTTQSADKDEEESKDDRFEGQGLGLEIPSNKLTPPPADDETTNREPTPTQIPTPEKSTKQRPRCGDHRT
ncbi:hypothetical protein RUND412_011485 [Rhizina undulata]